MLKSQKNVKELVDKGEQEFNTWLKTDYNLLVRKMTDDNIAQSVQTNCQITGEQDSEEKGLQRKSINNKKV